MHSLLQTRADARALFSAALAGAAVGLVLGACYLAGGLASAASRHMTVSRLAGTAGGGYSDTALIAAPGADAGVLAVMRRRDPSFSGMGESDRQLAVFAGRLNRETGMALANANTSAGLLLRASLGGAYNPAAAPFRSAGGLAGSRELECLTQAVYYEARGEGPNGQAAVAQVVLNRVRHPAFPKSICGVVFQRAGTGVKCQFSFACDGSLRRAQEPRAWRRAERIASRALAGSVMADVGNATHFHTTAVAPTWGPHLMRVAQVGLHVFYRFGGRSGAPGAFTRTPLPSSGEDPTLDMVVAGVDPADTSSVALAAVAQAASASVALAPNLAQGLASSGVGGSASKASEPASAPEGVKAAEPVKTRPTTAPAAATALKAASDS